MTPPEAPSGAPSARSRPTVLGRLATIAIATAAVLAALAAFLPALDAHHQLEQQNTRHQPRHELPPGCWSAHEVLRDGQVWRLCDFYRPTPQPAPSPRPQPRETVT